MDYKQFEIREGLVFLIELTPGLLEPCKDLGGSTQLLEILRAINDLMADLVITMKATGVGIYLYNMGPNTHAKPVIRKAGFYKLFSMNSLNTTNMKLLTDLVVDLESGTRKTSDLFSYEPPEQNHLASILGKVLDEFMAKPYFNMRKCMWFTANDKPYTDNDTYVAVRRVIDDFYSYGYLIDPVFLGSDFDMAKYRDLFLNTNYMGKRKEPSFNTQLNSQIREGILRIKEVRRQQFACNLVLSDGAGVGAALGCSVRGYSLYQPEKLKTDLHLHSEEGVLKRVYTDSKVLVGDQEVQETTRGFSVPGDVLLVGNDLMEFMSVYAFESERENEQMKEETEEDFDYPTITTPPYLKLVGFRNMFSFVPVYNSATPLFVTVDFDDGQSRESGGYTNSAKTFASLYHSCAKLDKYAVVFGCTKRNSKPTLYAMMPTKEAHKLPAGFVLVRMPWLDDLRPLPFAFSRDAFFSDPDGTPDTALDKVTGELEELFAQFFVKRYVPAEYPNPSLNHFYDVVKHELLQMDYEEKGEAHGDASVRKLQELHARLNKVGKGEIDRVRAYLGSLEPEPEEPVLKKPKIDRPRLTDDDVRAALQSDTLNKMTVAQLKEYLRGRGVEGGKKAECVEKIRELFIKGE